VIKLDEISEDAAKRIQEAANRRKYDHLSAINNWQIVKTKIFRKCAISGRWILPLTECYYGEATIWLDDAPLMMNGVKKDHLLIENLKFYVSKEALIFARIKGKLK
jgi:hypothetical protein